MADQLAEGKSQSDPVSDNPALETALDDGLSLDAQPLVPVARERKSEPVEMEVEIGGAPAA